MAKDDFKFVDKRKGGKSCILCLQFIQYNYPGGTCKSIQSRTIRDEKEMQIQA